MQIPLIIVRELLKGKHFSVEERVQKGAPVTAVIKYSDLLEILKGMINEVNWFPFRPEDPGNINYEGVIIEKVGNKYISHSQRTDPTNPDVFSGESEKEFNSIDEVAEYYMKWNLHLPGDLDGYTVVKEI